MTKIPRALEEQGGERPAVRSRGRRILRGLARALAALALLILAALAVVLHDLDARVHEALVAQAGELSRVIGRTIALGAVHINVGFTAEIVVRDVVIAGAEGATGALAEPLVRLPAIRLGVRLAPLVRSWGKSIVVTRVELEGPEITLVRTAEGLSIDDVRARLAASPPRPRPSSRIALESLAIRRATLHLRALDGAPGDELDIDSIRIDGADVRADAPSRLHVTAASAPGGRLEATIDLAPLAGAAAGSRVALKSVALRTAGVRLGLDLEGHVAKNFDLTRGALRLGALSLAARGKVWSADHLDLAFDWREAPLGSLLALFPDTKARLAGTTIEGQLAGSGTLRRDDGTTELATDLRLRSALLRRGALALLGAPHVAVALLTAGDKVSARVDADLGAATLAVAPVFNKAAGRPARLAFVLTREGSRVQLGEARLALPGATIEGLSLALEPRAAHLEITTATVALGPLALLELGESVLALRGAVRNGLVGGAAGTLP